MAISSSDRCGEVQLTKCHSDFCEGVISVALPTMGTAPSFTWIPPCTHKLGRRQTQGEHSDGVISAPWGSSGVKCLYQNLHPWLNVTKLPACPLALKEVGKELFKSPLFSVSPEISCRRLDET